MDLDRLRAAMQGTIDTGEISERKKFRRLKRDANGVLPPKKSILREAVAQEMQHRHLTIHRLWLLAQAHYPALSEAAVDEFLKGQRPLELPAIEALLAAVQLRIVRRKVAPRRQTRRATKGRSRSL
jgi:hypothetical protein